MNSHDEYQPGPVLRQLFREASADMIQQGIMELAEKMAMLTGLRAGNVLPGILAKTIRLMQTVDKDLTMQWIDLALDRPQPGDSRLPEWSAKWEAKMEELEAELDQYDKPG